jgi:hypothetical protein
MSVDGLKGRNHAIEGEQRGEKPAAKKLVKIKKKLALELERSMIGCRLEKV